MAPFQLPPNPLQHHLHHNQTNVQVEETQTLLGRSRASSLDSIEAPFQPSSFSKQSPAIEHIEHAFPLSLFSSSSVQDLEKQGAIHLSESPQSSSFPHRLSFKCNRRFWVNKARSIPPLYVFYFTLFLLYCLFPESESPATWSLLYSRASPSSPLYRDLPVTLGVVPKRVHSHNDYEQPHPLFAALAFGASSVEADVWLIDGQVRIGHHKRDATVDRTLRKVYIEPLIAMLQQANPTSGDAIKGIFSMAPEVSLQFLIDFKEGSTELYEAVLAELEPLRSRRFLTTYNGTSMSSSAITIVGSGEARLDLITAQQNRDLFYDAPLDKLSSAQYAHITPSISPMASAKLSLTGYSNLLFWRSAPYQKMQEFIDVAHSKGITARYWGTPRSPPWLRRTIWKALVARNVDWLNSDHLQEATMF